MTKRVLFGLCAVIAVVCARNPFAQEREDRTLLTHEQMRAIVSEASGERAMHHVLELVPYPRIRPIAEYQGHFRESEVMAGFAKEYGFSSVEIESFPSAQRSWAPTMGELWLVTPTEQKKLYDIHDVAVSVAANSKNGDVTGELVDVGLGTRAEDYAGKDLKGKVAIGGGGVAQIFAMASQRGAIGAVGYSTLYPDRGVDVIPSSSIAVNARGLRLGRVAAPGPRAGRAPRARREALAPLGDQGRDAARRAGNGARDDRRRSELDAGRHHLRATCTRAISSRAPTTTTPAAR